MKLLPRVLAGLLLFLCFTCEAPENRKTVVLRALDDFYPSEHPDYVPFYQHGDKEALAIDAAKYKDRFALVQTIFAGAKDEYRVEITTLGETDGESTYELFVDNEPQGKVTNAPTQKDYAPQVHSFGTFKLQPGQMLSIAFNSASNDKIPEGDGFAYARGRWTQLRLIPE
ncbi:MAG: hypothetical protein AAFZ52_09685 [Bacteroidota bacterium]